MTDLLNIISFIALSVLIGIAAYIFCVGAIQTKKMLTDYFEKFHKRKNITECPNCKSEKIGQKLDGVFVCSNCLNHFNP